MIFLAALLMAFAQAEEALSTYQIQIPSSLKVIQQSEQKAGERKIVSTELRGDGAEVSLVIVGPLDQKQFDNYSKLETVAFEHLYESAITPYPDKISHETSCPKEFHPRKSVEGVFGKKADVYSAKANSRKIFGVCTKAEAAYDGAISIVHLANGYAAKVSAFVKSGSAAKVIARFKAIEAARK